MKKDLSSRNDVVQLVNAFYLKIDADELLGPVFTVVARVEWEKHLPVMYNFWSGILLSDQRYSGNPMKVHVDLNHIFPLVDIHFERWLELFRETVGELFEGPKAKEAVDRAVYLSSLMQQKIRDAEKASLDGNNSGA